MSKGATQLRVHLLGGFSIEGFEERSLGSRKARVLLKRLAVGLGKPVAADELIQAIWGDDTPSKPGDQLSVLVSRSRGVLGAERVPRTDAGYALAADWFDLDELDDRVDELEARLQSGETSSALAASQAALALAAGTLLPEEEGDWVDEARPAADRLTARARLLAAEAALAAGQVDAARASAQIALDHDPYDEAALRLAMRADAMAARPGAALATYAAFRHRLAEELGADPARETEELHTAVLRGEITGVRDHRQSTVVGREQQLETLDNLLARAAGGEPTAAVVEAEAGMGKTALLTLWAARAGATALVVSGRCDELGHELPLQPMIDGLAAHLDSVGRDVAAELVGPEAAVIDPLLGRSGTTDVTGTTVVPDVATGRSVLFAALNAVLRRAAGGRPLVLLVDDLHRAAAGTAELLTFALRRGGRLLVVASRRPEPGPDLVDAARITLGPLDVEAAAELFGRDRAAMLHERSGGHPLLLTELAAAPGDELPESIVAAIGAQLDHLGESAQTLEVAAGCGRDVDVQLLVAASARSVPDVLDDLERAARAGLLRPRGAGLAFSHEIVREAIEARTSGPKRAAIHRAAVTHLASRPEADALALARHARLAGDPSVASSALVMAAATAAERFEFAAAGALLDEAIHLHDSAAARLARGRVRLSRLEVDGAMDDARHAVDQGAGVEGFELAGWVSYYQRDYATALRYADEGVARADGDGMRASCLALSGRVLHTQGELAGAKRRLEKSVAVAPAGIRSTAQTWHAQLLGHTGHPAEAAEEARRSLLDPHLAHPFAAGHSRFTLAYALGTSGQWAAALAAVDDLDALVARNGDKRFPPVAANVRGWLLRGAGQLDAAMELHNMAAESSPGPTFKEAHYAALLDIAECHLAAGRLHDAQSAIAMCADIVGWRGAMWWRHITRYRLIAARVASRGGDHAEAADTARAVATEAGARGDGRYARRAEIVATTIEARMGSRVDPAELSHVCERYLPLAGPDGWRDLGELAAAAGSDEAWALAEKTAAAIAAQVTEHPGFDAVAVADALRLQLESLRR